MDQTANGNFRTKESFTHSCLGRLVIVAGVLLIVLILAVISVPGKQTMTEEVEDAIRECITTHDSIQADGLDDAIDNIGYIFTTADTTFSQEKWATFNKYNRLQYHKHLFYSSMHVHNNLRPQGSRVGIGIFGLVIPTVQFKELLMNVSPIHKGYDQGLNRQVTVPDTYMGDQPHIKEYHYKGEEYN